MKKYFYVSDFSSFYDCLGGDERSSAECLKSIYLYFFCSVVVFVVLNLCGAATQAKRRNLVE